MHVSTFHITFGYVHKILILSLLPSDRYQTAFVEVSVIALQHHLEECGNSVEKTEVAVHFSCDFNGCEIAKLAAKDKLKAKIPEVCHQYVQSTYDECVVSHGCWQTLNPGIP